MSLLLADLARNPGRKATGDDGAVYVWDEQRRVHTGDRPDLPVIGARAGLDLGKYLPLTRCSG